MNKIDTSLHVSQQSDSLKADSNERVLTTPSFPKATGIEVVRHSSFQERETRRDEFLDHFEEALSSHQKAQQTHRVAVQAVVDKENTTFRKLSRPLTACFPKKPSRSHEKVATATEELASTYNQLSEVLSALEYQDPQEVSNTAHYSEERILLGDESYPESGYLLLGRAIRDQLKAVHENFLLEQLESPPESAGERKMFAEIKRDLHRATFIIKRASLDPNQPSEEELLFDHNDKIKVKAELRTMAVAQGEAANEKIIEANAISILQERGIEKFKTFVGDDRALQIAIGSLMYQRAAADLEFMKHGFSRAASEGLAPYFTSGFETIKPLQEASTISIRTKPEKQVVYSLEKIPSGNEHDCFELTIFNSCTEERVCTATKQEFTLHTADILIYTFEKNPAFDVNRPVSLDHLPVIINCTGGKILHQLTPFEGVRPLPPDTISLSAWDALTEEQQVAVTTYQEAEKNYLDAKKQWESKLIYLESRTNLGYLGSLITLEKATAEEHLASLRCILYEKAALVAQDSITAPFLERNFITTEGKTRTLPSLSEENKKLALPEELSFVGCRELQQRSTKQMKSALLDSANQRFNGGALVGTANRLGFRTQETFLSSSSAGSFDEEASQALLDFAEHEQIAKVIHMLVENPAAAVTPQLRKEPLFGDMLSLLPDAEPRFTLEKKRHPSSDKPLFILTVKYHESRTSISVEEDTKHFSRTLDARFVYTLTESPTWDYTDLNSLKNLPVDARCTGIYIDQKMERVSS